MKAKHGLFVFLTVLLFLNLHVYPAFATVIFSDGFESGNFSAWNGTSATSGDSITVVTTDPHHGTYHSQASMSAVSGSVRYAYAYKTLDLSEFYVRFYFKLKDNLPFTTSDDELMLLYARGTAGIFQAGFSAIPVCLKGNYRSGTTWTSWYNTSIHPELDVWHYIEIYWKKDATNGVFRVYYDGQVAFQATGKDTSRYGNVTEIRVGCTYYIFASAQALRVFTDCVVVADTYIGPEGGAPTEYTFYGNIPLTFTLGSIKGFSFVRQGTIPLTFTFLSTITQAIAKNFYGSIPLTFSIESLKAMTFNLFGSIPLTFTFEGTATFTHGILLKLYGTIPLIFTLETLKAINLNIFGSIPIQFAINGIAQYITKHLFFYGTIPLQFILRHAMSGLPEIAIDWGMAAMGMTIVAFAIAIVAFTTRKHE